MILVPVAGSAVFVTLVPLQDSQLLEVGCGKIYMDLRQLCLMFIS